MRERTIAALAATLLFGWMAGNVKAQVSAGLSADESGIKEFTLVHPLFGVVWDRASGSMAHGHKNMTCRCTAEPEIDFSDLLARITKLLGRLDVTLGR
jgi:hypothetical protein